jgi:hypothetical protein
MVARLGSVRILLRCTRTADGQSAPAWRGRRRNRKNDTLSRFALCRRGFRTGTHRGLGSGVGIWDVQVSRLHVLTPRARASRQPFPQRRFRYLSSLRLAGGSTACRSERQAAPLQVSQSLPVVGEGGRAQRGRVGLYGCRLRFAPPPSPWTGRDHGRASRPCAVFGRGRGGPTAEYDEMRHREIDEKPGEDTAALRRQHRHEAGGGDQHAGIGHRTQHA